MHQAQFLKSSVWVAVGPLRTCLVIWLVVDFWVENGFPSVCGISLELRAGCVVWADLELLNPGVSPPQSQGPGPRWLASGRGRCQTAVSSESLERSHFLVF